MRDSDVKRDLGIRLGAILNEVANNPLDDLMTFYWFNEELALREIVCSDTELGWMSYVHYYRNWFVDLADSLFEDDCREFSPRVST